MIRKIVQIDKDKCNGCGLCVNACHEGAIEVRDGKAVLVSDEYCDGLGNCLPECPTGAIEIIERESKAFDEGAVKERMEKIKEKQEEKKKPAACGCPGTMAKKLQPQNKPAETKMEEHTEKMEIQSQLMQWPVQLNLINPHASYFEDANLLVAADCTAYAYANFHNQFIKDHITVIGCPKLDDINFYEEKLTEIISSNNIKSITAVRMEVPCCGGIINAVRKAMLNAQKIVPYREVIISANGEIRN